MAPTDVDLKFNCKLSPTARILNVGPAFFFLGFLYTDCRSCTNEGKMRIATENVQYMLCLAKKTDSSPFYPDQLLEFRLIVNHLIAIRVEPISNLDTSHKTYVFIQFLTLERRVGIGEQLLEVCLEPLSGLWRGLQSRR